MDSPLTTNWTDGFVLVKNARVISYNPASATLILNESCSQRKFSSSSFQYINYLPVFRVCIFHGTALPNLR